MGYSKYKNWSKPNIILLNYLKKRKKEYKIVVLTARSKILHKHTISLIKKHHIKLQGVYSRTDITSKDEEWKLQRLKQYVKKYSIVELYEDKMENIKYIKKRIEFGKVKFYLVKSNSIKEI